MRSRGRSAKILQSTEDQEQRFPAVVRRSAAWIRDPSRRPHPDDQTVPRHQRPGGSAWRKKCLRDGYLPVLSPRTRGEGVREHLASAAGRGAEGVNVSGRVFASTSQADGLRQFEITTTPIVLGRRPGAVHDDAGRDPGARGEHRAGPLPRSRPNPRARAQVAVPRQHEPRDPHPV